MIAPGATLGVLGGGQLGRMFVHAAQQLGYRTAVLDPDPDSPAGLVSHHHIRTGYLDAQGLDDLARVAAAVTTEFENVPADALATLAKRMPVSPAADAVAIAQDRAREKAHFRSCGVPCAPHVVIAGEDDLAKVPATLLPGILKTARLGYDGKGQQTVATPAELCTAWQALGRVPCVLEQRLALQAECSVVLARGAHGEVVHLPVQRNLHRGGILAFTQVHEGVLPPALCRQAQEASRAIADGLGYVGVLCVEFFVLQDGALVVNEIAPRPHNSGHWSIDGSDISQFDLQVRTLAGLPLVAPRQTSPAVMLNLLGELWFDHRQAQREPDWAAVLALPGAHLHLYGKPQPRVGRKMGHLTFTASDIKGARLAAARAAEILGLEPFSLAA